MEVNNQQELSLVDIIHFLEEFHKKILVIAVIGPVLGAIGCLLFGQYAVSATRKHALRKRAMILTTFLYGVRVGELAQLRVEDVIAVDGTIKTEVHLDKECTKHQHEHTFFINEYLRKELATFVARGTIVLNVN